MFRLSDLLDLPIISLSTGKSICTIKSVLIDLTQNKVFAFSCKEGIIKKYIQIIPYRSMLNLNYNEVIVFDKRVIEKMPVNTLKIKKIADHENILRKFLIDSNGELIGTVTDIYFDEKNGNVLSYEFSEGYLDDFINGRRRIDYYGRTTVKSLNATSNENKVEVADYHKN